MKAAIIIFVALLTMFADPVPVGAESGLEPHRVYVVGGDENFPPYEFVVEVDGVKAYRGFNVDIMKAVALQTGIEIEFQPMTWASTLVALDIGQLDAIQGMKYNEQRAARYDFVDYLTSAQSIFVRKETVVTDLDSLRGHKIAVQGGDVAFQRLHASGAYELVVVADQEEAFNRLLGGQVMAVIGNKLAGQYILQKNKQVDLVKIVGSDIEPGRYGVAIRKGDLQTLRIMQKGIEEIKRNGTYDKIYSKWFGQPVDYPSAYYRERLVLALSILAVLLFVLALMLYLSYALRQEVHRRTTEIAAINRELLERNEYIKKENLYKEKVLNSGYNGIVTLDGQGYLQYVNDYADKYLACRDAIGRHYTATAVGEFFPVGHGEPGDQGQIADERIILGYLMEYTITRLPAVGQLEVLVLEFRDVTVERQLREQVFRKDKMEALGSLVAGIAHEIRTPLTSIKTFAELLPDKYDNPSFRQKISFHVPQEVERVDAMVNNLLDYAKPRKPSRQPTLVQGLVQEVLVLCGGRLKSAGVRVGLQVPDDARAYGDRQQLQQVIINTLLNAIDAMGGVDRPQIAIRWTEADRTGTLVIEDNGCGMDEQTCSRIFDPFFTTKPTGTGLGLAISYQYITENDGKLWVESAPGTGTKVFIQLQTEERGGSDVQTAHR